MVQVHRHSAALNAKFVRKILSKVLEYSNIYLSKNFVKSKYCELISSRKKLLRGKALTAVLWKLQEHTAAYYTVEITEFYCHSILANFSSNVFF